MQRRRPTLWILLLATVLNCLGSHCIGQELRRSISPPDETSGSLLPLSVASEQPVSPARIESSSNGASPAESRSNAGGSRAGDVAGQILHRALMESVWGRPVLCEVRQNIRQFNKKRSSFGKYVRGGQGSGKMRLSLQVPAGDQMNSLLQVSDGELLSTLLNVGEHSTRTQVDLGKIRDRLTITTHSLQNPVVAMYLAVGGQAELLRKLCQQYEWTSVTEGRLGQNPVWWISGSASEKPPAQRSIAPIDVRLFETKSGPNPFRATIAIGHMEGETPFWLYQVEETYQDDKQPQWQLTVLTEWDSPVALAAAQLIPDLFRLGASDTQSLYESRDETKLYLPPLQTNVVQTNTMDSLR